MRAMETHEDPSFKFPEPTEKARPVSDACDTRPEKAEKAGEAEKAEEGLLELAGRPA